MNAFLSDLLHDLREKRLWPVAAALLVALVAVPVLLAKPAPSDKPAPATPLASEPAADAAKKTIPVELAEVAQGDDSKLEAFDPKNPFKPKVKQVNLSDQTAKALDEIASESAGAGDLAGSDGGNGTGTDGGTGGGTVPTTPVTPTEPGAPKVAQYTYVLDVTFEHNGKRRVIKGMDKLSMLPSESNPALLFLGVTSGGDDAVFLVDSGLEAHGEGNCSPGGKICATVSLGAGSEHFFTDAQGNSYSLRVDQIRKVKVSAAVRKAARRAKSARSSVASTANAAAAPIRRFVPPILADLVTVASDATNNSSSHQAGR